MRYWSAKWALRVSGAAVGAAAIYTGVNAMMFWESAPAIAVGNLITSATMLALFTLCEAVFQIMQRMEE
ncbi:MAG: hypothetical protein INF91_04835 [Alphaproteobacteria bacterium]|nr:hypothetical protein [Alphaproteobacteria bacterium]